MWSRTRIILQSNQAFAKSIDAAIKERSMRISDIVDKIEQHATRKSTAQKFSDIHEYLFLSARVYRMCTRSAEDRERITQAVENVTAFIPWERLSDDQVAKSLWSIASVRAHPKGLKKIQFEKREFTSNKSFANVIWSLARFTESSVPDLNSVAKHVVVKMNQQRANGLSDDELISILRAYATIQSE